MMNLRYIKIILFLLLLILLPNSLLAFDLDSQVKEIRLSNGMKWLIVHRPGIPIFSGVIMLRVGGADEEEGKTGLAHMFEHMAFKGSKEIGVSNYNLEKPILKKIAKLGRKLAAERQRPNPNQKMISDLRGQMTHLELEANPYRVKNEVWSTFSLHGGVDLNAFTSKDLTGYHASMPSHQFPLWAYVNSEMIFNPVMREFYSELDVVMEERRLRYDNSPRGYMIENLILEAFPSGPYHWAPIGFQKDLAGFTMEDAEAFHKRFYVPENMVGTLVGSISPKRARMILEQFFGKARKKKAPKMKRAPNFAFKGEVRKEISYPAEPYLMMGFHKPNAPKRTDYVFDMIDGIMCEGRTGRFYKKLVQQDKVASSVRCSTSFPGVRYNNLFVIFASPNKGRTLKELEEAITRELEGLKKEIDSPELEKVRRWSLYNFTWSLEDNMHLARQLAYAETVLKNWRYITTYDKVLKTIRVREVKNVASKYFKPKNRIVVYRNKGKQK